ncbi:MAG: GNAT family N-acetyltransferase [Parachlamydiales bacterium]|nr:GNAT family N-acetyltransferase [Parachlamydiales bacterium]
MTNEKIKKEILQTFYAFWTGGNLSSSYQVDEHDDRIRYLTGIPLAIFNGIIRAKHPTEEIINATIDYFRKIHLPFLWWQEPGTHVENWMHERGFHDMGPFVAVGGDISAMAICNNQLYTVRPVQTSKEFETWYDLIDEGFAVPPDCKLKYKEWLLNYGPKLIHYNAYKNHKPVGTVSLQLGSIGGIWNLTVLEKHRNKGVGTALIQHCLKECLLRDIVSCMAMLMPDRQAESLFNKLGMPSLFEMTGYCFVP